MSNNCFWNETLKLGAILGALMSISTMLESYVIYYSAIPLVRASMIYLAEWLVVVVAYVWLMYRFTKSYSNRYFDEGAGFSFSQGFGFVITLSLFVAIMVGVTTTLFYSVMGFDGFIDGYIARIDELVAYMGANNIAMNSVAEDIELLRDNIRALQQPSMLSNILAAINNYVLSGLIIGLTIAAILRRKPVIVERNENE